jgi:hypothetical protein
LIEINLGQIAFEGGTPMARATTVGEDMRMSRGMKRTLAVLVVALVPLVGTIGVVTGSASAVPANTLFVSTTGTDSAGCGTNPGTACATINTAIGNAVPGETVKVAPGTYHQTVTIDKPIRLFGAGARRTTIDGSGIDSSGPNYGVVFVGTTGGAVEVKGFTITNPFPDTFTGGEPEVVALKDTNASDSVVITRNVISEGTADVMADADFPIGIDTFQNAATTSISHNTVRGTFQGALLEDNGPVTFDNNKITELQPVTADASTFAPEGLFFLSDLAGSITGQDAGHNSFTHYAGYGIIMQAGFDNSNCSTTPCTGSISGILDSNHLALGGAADADGILLDSEFSGDDLTATLTDNRGFVTTPSGSVAQTSEDGATINVMETGDHIVIRP